MTLTCVVLKFAGKLPTCSSVPRRLLCSAAPSRTLRWTIDSHFEWALLWYQTERVLQTSANASENPSIPWQISRCFNVFEINHSFTVSTFFKRLSMLLPTSRLLALLEPKPQAFRRWDFALSFCHILVRFRWFDVHDINIYMNTKCDGEWSLRFVMLCAYWFKGSSDASTCNLWRSLQKTAFVCPHKPHASGRPTTFVLQTSLLDLGLELTIRSAEILSHVTAITICWQVCSLSVNVLPSWCWPWKESAAWKNWQFSYHARSCS